MDAVRCICTYSWADISQYTQKRPVVHIYYTGRERRTHAPLAYIKIGYIKTWISAYLPVYLYVYIYIYISI